MRAQSLGRSFLPFVFWLSSPAVAIRSVPLDPDDVPSSDRQVIGPDFQAFSIETASWFDYTGNSTYDNVLNTNLVQNIRDIGKVAIHVRIGGSSGNTVTYDPDQAIGMNTTYPATADKATAIIAGPAFAEGFAVWPNDTLYYLGVPFSFTNFSRLDTDIGLAEIAYKALGSRLASIEIGNEYNSKQWNPTKYVNLWLPYARNISEAVFGEEKPLFMVGDLQEADYINATCIEVETTDCWTVESLLKLGILDSGLGMGTSVHIASQYLAGSGSDVASMTYMLNHSNTVHEVKTNTGFIADYVESVDIPYYIGETNSFSGHGLSGVSDRYGAALWSINYVLYSATSQINRLFFHQGTGWKYSAWNPVQINSIPAGVKGAYFSWLVTATALSGGGKQVELLHEEEFLVAYAIYADGDLESIIAINLAPFSSGDEERGEVAIKLPSGFEDAQVTRLTAPFVDQNWGITWGGQGVDTEGVLNGTAVTETVEGLTVGLFAGEAVLISLK
ncbi:hypothetical protein G7054_g2573 [Neopestalotiopsis clavispora]|nr:hypothetical protein G7054_g2573 [Neopestalotiopsis clavispora]